MKQLILFILILFFLCGCDKDSLPTVAPTITTGVASNVMNTTATVGLFINNASNSKEIGVLYGSSSAILASMDAQKGVIVNFKSGNNSVSLTGLSKGTTYYYKAYATDKYITIYGDMKTFTTGIDYPTLTTNTVSSITSTRATCGGSISSNGGGTITAKGVCWSTASNPTIDLATKTVDGTGTGSFTSSITGLLPETTYYVRAYATNEKGTAYGAQVTFKTLPVSIPTVTTTSITYITTTTATSGGNITDDGGATVTARGVCWSTTSNPTTVDSKTSDGTGTGTFTSSITGLTANTTYYVRAYATNSTGTGYGSTLSFKAVNTQTINGYTLTQNEIWSGTILLKGDIVVPSGITLTINPGTIINIYNGTPVYNGGISNNGAIDFVIYGNLIINGTYQNIVQLKSLASTPTNFEWDGIHMTSGGRLEINYCYLGDAFWGVYCSSSNTAMKIKNCLFNNTCMAIVDFGSLQHTLSYNSFINVSSGYDLRNSNKNAQLDYTEFKNNSCDIDISGTTSDVVNNSTINVNYSNSSENSWCNFSWSSGGAVTNCKITANHCYGITTSYPTNGYGNTLTNLNQLSSPYSGAGCGFSFMAKSPSVRSNVISSNPEQLKRTLKEHNEEIKQQYQKMKRRQTY